MTRTNSSGFRPRSLDVRNALQQSLTVKQAWLDAAVQGGEFLRNTATNGNRLLFLAYPRRRPLVQPYNIFSNTFACMAFAQLAKATGSEEYAEIARRTFRRILERRSNPKGQWLKAYPGTLPMKDFTLPMIICNMALEVEDIINDPELIERTIDESVHEIVDVFGSLSLES